MSAAYRLEPPAWATHTPSREERCLLFAIASPHPGETFVAVTRYEAYIEKDWREHGLAHLLVARIKENDSVDLGVFLTDVWCLGVKDAFGESDLSKAEFSELLEERLPESMRQPIHPNCAKKLIEGSVAYAEGLGFAPHRDFRKAKRVLSGLDASLCPTEFSYGRDGRPFYVQGSEDSEDRVDRVLAILEARVGPDGYDFEPADDGANDESDLIDLREDLIEWLDAEPPDVPRFYAVSGMVTALHICPETVPPTKLLDALWGSEGRVWGDAAELEEFTTLLMNYWNHVGDLVAAVLAPDAPPGEHPVDVWPEDFPEDDPLPFTAASMEWAAGFLRTSELWPEAWGDALARPEFAPHWEVVRWWAEFSRENLERIAESAEARAPRTLAASVTALARALRPSAPPPLA